MVSFYKHFNTTIVLRDMQNVSFIVAKKNILLNLVLHGGHSIFMWQQNLVSGTAEVT